MVLNGKNILLVITGGIAAYKALDLIRRLRERGGVIRCVMTKGAKEFITPLSVQALCENPVMDDLFNLTQEDEIGHIRLSRAADLVIVAPASADFLAKMAHGLADDLASAVLLANNKPLLVAPAMNPHMWAHPATRRNVEQLKGDGVFFIGPETGEMAERNEAGTGRLSEPLTIVQAAEDLLTAPKRSCLPKLEGKKILITAGPTHEPIDPVRYIANRSSGKQGYALAEVCVEAGAAVTLISGPVNLAPPDGLVLKKVETASEMLQAVKDSLPADIAIMAAAVADWRVDKVAMDKIKKGEEGYVAPLFLSENPDILKTLCAMENRPSLVVGFAAETEKILEYAQIKLSKKGADMIVANNVAPKSFGGIGVMGGDRNIVHLVTADGHESWKEMTKNDVAKRLVTVLAEKI